MKNQEKGWEKEHLDFYNEDGKYRGRELGYKAHRNFISNLLEEVVREIVGEELDSYKRNTTTDEAKSLKQDHEVFERGINHCRKEIINRAKEKYNVEI